jgi:hypothetical protein
MRRAAAGASVASNSSIGTIRCSRERPAAPDGDAAARLAGGVQKLADQARLADPRIAADEHDAAVYFGQGAPALDEKRKLVLPAKELRTHDRCRDQTIETPLRLPLLHLRHANAVDLERRCRFGASRASPREQH